MPCWGALLLGLIATTLTISSAARQRPGASDRVLFHDVGKASGLDVTHVNGASPDKPIAEIMGSGALFFDFDDDGWIDVFLVDGGSNDGGSRSNALFLRLVGGATSLTTDPERVEGVGTDSNRDAIGARPRLTSRARTQVREVTSGSSYLGQNDPRLHVGLVDATIVDALEIRWPSGRTEIVQNVAADRLIGIREDAGVVESTPFQRR